MIRATLGSVKTEVARVCGSTGMPVSDPRVVDRINDAQQELMNEGDFPGVVDRWHIVSTSGNIVLPPHLDRLMQIAIAGVPRTIKSPWFEFVQYGPGPAEDQNFWNQTWCDVNGILDRGETPTVTRIPDPADVTGPWRIRVYATVAEDLGAYLTVQGLDVNGLQIRSQITSGSSAGDWYNGENVNISSGSSYYQTTHQFSEVTAVSKPETNGYVRMTAWNGATEIELSNYAPHETNPSYRWYYSTWLAGLTTSDTRCKTIRARCRRRFVPVSEDTDVLIIGNVIALKEMVIAQWKRTAGNGEEYALHKQTSTDLLRKEAAGYRGKSRIPGLTFQRGFGIGSLPGIR